MSDKPKLLKASDVLAHEESDAHPWNPKSQIRGTMLSRLTGLSRSGVNLIKLASGMESFVYHSHYYEEEWMYVLAGRGIADVDGVEHEIGPGDFLGFPTGTAHQTRNPFAEELVYLSGGEHRDYEVADFPRIDRRMIRRGEEIDIFKISQAKKIREPLD
jgi:uncharacterized cupin superfamily protein